VSDQLLGGRYPSARLLIFFVPMPAVLIGVLVMKQSGVPSALWIQNLAVAATMLAGTLTATRTLTLRRWSPLSLIAVVVALASSRNDVH
jgi:hypothetical protein